MEPLRGTTSPNFFSSSRIEQSPLQGAPDLNSLPAQQGLFRDPASELNALAALISKENLLSPQTVGLLSRLGNSLGFLRGVAFEKLPLLENIIQEIDRFLFEPLTLAKGSATATSLNELLSQLSAEELRGFAQSIENNPALNRINEIVEILENSITSLGKRVDDFIGKTALTKTLNDLLEGSSPKTTPTELSPQALLRLETSSLFSLDRFSQRAARMNYEKAPPPTALPYESKEKESKEKKNRSTKRSSLSSFVKGLYQKVRSLLSKIAFKPLISEN